MEKVVLNRESVKSIYEMYNSPDKENHVVANEILNNCDIDASEGWLIIFYGMSLKSDDYWLENMPNVFVRACKLGIQSDHKLSAAQLVNALIVAKVEPEIMDYYLEIHVEDLKRAMSNWGYPVNKLNYSITLKNEE